MKKDIKKPGQFYYQGGIRELQRKAVASRPNQDGWHYDIGLIAFTQNTGTINKPGSWNTGHAQTIWNVPAKP